MAAMLGQQVVNKSYRKVRITVAFHPGEERFEVANPAIQRDRAWLADIATLFTPDTRLLRVVDAYCESNPESNKDQIYERIEWLRGIRNNLLGLIELNADLNVETVSEIFVRINSQGVTLNAADFAMSKMAANERYNGHQLRKCIDYFCHLAVAPEAYSELAGDSEFEEVIAEDAFSRLDAALLRFMNETNFKRFVMILRSAGFVNASMIRSQNAVNFAYIVYLTLRARDTHPTLIETLVRRWFIMSVLTGRYTGSPETAFGVDIRNITEQNAQDCLEAVEQARLSDVFWDTGLPQQMDTSVASSSYFKVFLASQVKGNDKGFLSNGHTVRTLLEGASQVHHVFPRNYLKKRGLARGAYNQIANYVVMQGEINIAIGDAPPASYFSALWRQCANGESGYGGITDADELRANLQAHCIPEDMEEMDVDNYNGFLKERRRLMARKIRDYYRSL